MKLNSSETYTWIIFSSVVILVTMFMIYSGQRYSFKFISFLIAMVVLLVFCIMAYHSTNIDIQKKKWPPTISACPDYWVEDNSGGETLCNNTKNLGLDTCPKVVNMDEFEYDSKLLANNDCDKAKWARSCNLTWDGITNNQDVCK